MSNLNELMGNLKRYDHVVTDPWICLDCKAQFEPSLNTQCPSCFSGNTVFDEAAHSKMRTTRMKSGGVSSIVVEVWNEDGCALSKDFSSLDEVIELLNSKESL